MRFVSIFRHFINKPERRVIIMVSVCLLAIALGNGMHSAWFFGSDGISPDTLASYPKLSAAQASTAATTKYDTTSAYQQYHSQLNKAP